MRQSFLSQLSVYENKLYQRGIGPKTSRWTELSESTFHLENEELILRNTYLNSQMAPLADLTNLPTEKTTRLQWVDQKGLGALAVENLDEDDLVNKLNPPRIQNHKK